MAKRSSKPPVMPRRPEQTFVREVGDEIFVQIGKCIAQWSDIEHVIEQVIWALLRLNIEEGRIVTSHLDARHKTLLLRQLGHLHLPSEDMEEFTTVLGRIEDLYERRNLIAHGQWVTLKPDNVPGVMSLREKLPDGTPRNEVITTVIPQSGFIDLCQNMGIVYNYLVELRKYASALHNKRSAQPRLE